MAPSWVPSFFLSLTRTRAYDYEDEETRDLWSSLKKEGTPLYEPQG